MKLILTADYLKQPKSKKYNIYTFNENKHGVVGSIYIPVKKKRKKRIKVVITT